MPVCCRSRPPRSLVLIGARVWPPRQHECIRGRHQPPAGIVFQGITALHAAPPAGTIRPPPPGADTALPAHRPPRRDLACRAEPRGQAGGGLRRGRTAGLSPLRHPQFRVCTSTVRFLRSRFSRGLLVQRPGRVPLVQRPTHGPDRRAPG